MAPRLLKRVPRHVKPVKVGCDSDLHVMAIVRIVRVQEYDNTAEYWLSDDIQTPGGAELYFMIGGEYVYLSDGVRVWSVLQDSIWSYDDTSCITIDDESYKIDIGCTEIHSDEYALIMAAIKRYTNSV